MKNKIILISSKKENIISMNVDPDFNTEPDQTIHFRKNKFTVEDLARIEKEIKEIFCFLQIVSNTLEEKRQENYWFNIFRFFKSKK